MADRNETSTDASTAHGVHPTDGSTTHAMHPTDASTTHAMHPTDNSSGAAAARACMALGAHRVGCPCLAGMTVEDDSLAYLTRLRRQHELDQRLIRVGSGQHHRLQTE